MSRELYLTSRVFFVSEVNLSSGDKLFPFVLTSEFEIWKSRLCRERFRQEKSDQVRDLFVKSGCFRTGG